MCSNALNGRGKPAVSPMSRGGTLEKNRNGANIKHHHALQTDGVIIILMSCFLGLLVRT